jgi:hypothetical protein
LSISSTNLECVAVRQAECGVGNLTLVLISAGRSCESHSACSAFGLLHRMMLLQIELELDDTLW